jgi:hypothetical protein
MNESAPISTITEFEILIDRLEADLDEHERAAREIRDTLASVRKRLAQAPGARAGKQARSGRKRRRALTDEANPEPLATAN